MAFKVAAFNVENLFDRAKAFNADDDTARKVLADTAKLNGLFEHGNYTDLRKQRMLELLDELGLTKSNTGPYVRLRQLRNQVVRRPRNGDPYIVAGGRDDWVGWVEAKTEPVAETAIDNTARVIRDVNADILAVVEAENRVALKEFSEHALARVDGTPYDCVMVIDGNDDRGIDVGVMTKPGFAIGDMRSHIHDRNDTGKPIFSRDCPEFAVTTPGGERVWVLPNHFKSKYGGNDQRSQNRRLAQAKRVAEIYEALRDAGEHLVIVLGDLNDTPDSEPLAPLLNGTDLRDVSEHDDFDVPLNHPDKAPRTGTYGSGLPGDKIDYLLASPALYARFHSAGLFRKGAWPGTRPPLWDVYPELKRKVHAASDHHVIWAVFND